MDAVQLFLFDPIPAKAKKLGLLSIYKFQMNVRRGKDLLRRGKQRKYIGFVQQKEKML
jgi:hypothetical protein